MAIETNYVNFHKNKKNHFVYELERSADITQPMSLVIIVDANFDINEIVINMSFANILLFSCNLRTLAKFGTNVCISHLGKNKQEINIDLPFGWLFGKFMTIKHIVSSPIITVFSSDTRHDIHNIKILYKSIYYDSDNRAVIHNTQMMILFQQIESSYVVIDKVENINEYFTFTKTIQLKSLVRGFFIESNNISEISHIDLKLNEHLRQTYYISNVKNKNKEHSDMYYFPLNDDYDYKTISRETLHGGQCNLRNGNITMSFSVHFKTKYTDLGIKFLNIHVLSLNKFKYDGNNNVSFEYIPIIQDLMLDKELDTDKADIHKAEDGLTKNESFQIPNTIEI